MNKGKRGLNSPLKVGRPSLYKEEYGQMLIDHLSKGGFVEGFSMKINVTVETLLDWTTKHAEFSESYKKARESQLEHFQKIGYGLATGQVKGQVAAWCFMMKNMFGWRDSQELQLQQQKGSKLIIKLDE